MEKVLSSFPLSFPIVPIGLTWPLRLISPSLNRFFWGGNFLNWSIVDLQCCVNFCCQQSDLVIHTLHFFLYSFHYGLISGYWILFPVLYSRISSTDFFFFFGLEKSPNLAIPRISELPKKRISFCWKSSLPSGISAYLILMVPKFSDTIITLSCNYVFWGGWAIWNFSLFLGQKQIAQGDLASCDLSCFIYKQNFDIQRFFTISIYQICRLQNIYVLNTTKWLSYLYNKELTHDFHYSQT